MGSGIESLERAYNFIFTAALIILAVLVILCLVRAIIGPRVADRIVSVNMTGTMVIVMIAILALMLGEGYLADICIIYAMISFLAVIVLVKVYMGVYLAGKQTESRESADMEPAEPGEGRAKEGLIETDMRRAEEGLVETKVWRAEERPVETDMQ